MDIDEQVGDLQDRLVELIGNAQDAAREEGYEQGFQAALAAMRDWRRTIAVDPDDDYQAHYLDGIDDAIATAEQNQ